MHGFRHAPSNAAKTIQCPHGFTGLLWSGRALLRRSIGVGDFLEFIRVVAVHAFSLTGRRAGRNGRIRTCDPLTPSQVRYLAALRSEPGPEV